MKNGKKQVGVKQGFGVVTVGKKNTVNTPQPTVIKSDNDLRAKK